MKSFLVSGIGAVVKPSTLVGIQGSTAGLDSSKQNDRSRKMPKHGELELKLVDDPLCHRSAQAWLEQNEHCAIALGRTTWLARGKQSLGCLEGPASGATDCGMQLLNAPIVELFVC